MATVIAEPGAEEVDEKVVEPVVETGPIAEVETTVLEDTTVVEDSELGIVEVERVAPEALQQEEL